MPRNFFKTFLFFVTILGLTLSNSSLAVIGLTNPPPPPGNTGILLTDYFVWEIGGAEHAQTAKYVLDIQGFTQSEDNIPPSKCDNSVAPVKCSFGFLELTIGSLNYFTWYTWRVTAYDASGNSVSASPELTFQTEQSSSGNGNGNGTNGTNGVGWVPEVVLVNPLTVDNIWEAIDALINWLFFLSFAIAPILIIYAAFLLMFRGDDPGANNRAKAIILWTLLALALIILAKGIPEAIRGALGG